MAGIGTKKKYGLRTNSRKYPVNPRVHSCPIWQIPDNTERNVVTNIQTLSGRRHMAGNNDADPTYCFTFDHHRTQGTPIVRRLIYNMLWLWRNWPHVSNLSQETEEKITSKDLTSTFANIAAHYSPTSGEPQKGTAEQASPTEQVSHTAKMIIYIDEPGLGNGQGPFEMASKPTCEQGQQRPPMGKAVELQPQSGNLEK